jgi:hypothetical protein
MLQSDSNDDGLRHICDEVKRSRQEITDAVIHEWGGIQKAETWLQLPEDLDQDHLPDLISAIADTALCTLFGETERNALVWVAVEHGRQRRSHGYQDDLLYREYSLLRRALWHVIRHRFARTGLASEAVIRVDAAITLATGGSLRGYYQQTLEATGDWPAAVERLSAEFSFGMDD